MTEAFKPLGVYLKFWGEGAPGNDWHRDPWFSIPAARRTPSRWC